MGMFIVIMVIILVFFASYSSLEATSNIKEICKLHKWAYNNENKLSCTVCNMVPNLETRE